MYRMTLRADPNSEHYIFDVDISINRNDVTIDDMLDMFRYFLKACSFDSGMVDSLFNENNRT